MRLLRNLWIELKWKQFGRCVAPFLFLEAFHELPRTRRWEFLGIGAVDGSFQTLAAGEHCPNWNLATVDLDHPTRLFEKCAVPASRLEAVRSHEHTALNHDSPDADDAVRLCTGANAEDLAGANRS